MFVDEKTQSRTAAAGVALGYGRFVQTDPIGYGDGLNWYNYVGGDPVNKSDPSGLAYHGSGCIERGDCSSIKAGWECYGNCFGSGYLNSPSPGDTASRPGPLASSTDHGGTSGASSGTWVGCQTCSVTHSENDDIVITGNTIKFVPDYYSNVLYLLRDNPAWGPRPTGGGACEIAFAACIANADKVYDRGDVGGSNRYYRACRFSYGNCTKSMGEYESSSWIDPYFAYVRFPYTGSVYFVPWVKPYFVPDTKQGR